MQLPQHMDALAQLGDKERSLGSASEPADYDMDAIKAILEEIKPA